MAKKTGLGRGLSNLIPGTTKGNTVDLRSHPEYQELPLSAITANPDQPRKTFAKKELEEMAKTLHSVGLIEPVIVRKKKDVYQLISGERRWRACQLAGFKKIPAIVKQVNDTEALEMGIIENIQREELNPVEEARAYEQWIEKTGQKPSVLADKVGKDRTTVTNLMRLLKLPDEVLKLIESKELTAGQVRPLIGIGDRKMLVRLAGRIAKEGWSARKVEEEVARIIEPAAKTSAKKTRSDPNVKNLEERLRAKFTAKAQVVHKKNGSGKITLHYGNLNDLDRLLESMGIKIR